MVVYSMAVAVMLASGEPSIPAVVKSFPTLKECRMGLLEVSKIGGFNLQINPMLNYVTVREQVDKTTVLFCIQTPLAI